MDSQGNLHELTEEQMQELLKHDVEQRDLEPIPPEEAEAVRAMNRHERRKWFRDRKLQLKRQAKREKTT
jgi:hypothetical protein